MIALIIVVVVVLLIVGALAGMYNGLIKLRNQVEEAWRQIDVELKRRHDLIGNLVETVKGYAAHERGTLEAVIAARGAAMAGGQGPAQQAQAEGQLTQALGRLMAVAEAYPDLKANTNFTALQNELTGTEDRIASARRYYNATVGDLNTKVESVPTNIIAGMFGIKRAEYFEVEGVEREVPKVDFGQRDSTIPPPSSYAGSEAPAAPPTPAAPAAPAAPAQVEAPPAPQVEVPPVAAPAPQTHPSAPATAPGAQQATPPVPPPAGPPAPGTPNQPNA